MAEPWLQMVGMHNPVDLDSHEEQHAASTNLLDTARGVDSTWKKAILNRLVWQARERL